MSKFAAFVLLGFLFACSGGGNNARNTGSPAPSPAAQSSKTTGAQPVVLNASTMTFKDADAACAGALGSITFVMGHARAHPASGVELHEQPGTRSGMMTMTFSDKANGKKATVSVNSHDRAVSGKNVTAKMNQSVACIGPDTR